MIVVRREKNGEPDVPLVSFNDSHEFVINTHVEMALRHMQLENMHYRINMFSYVKHPLHFGKVCERANLSFQMSFGWPLDDHKCLLDRLRPLSLPVVRRP